VEEARVLWVNGQEFGLDLRRLRPQDHQWLKDYLIRAEGGQVSGGRCGRLRPKGTWPRCCSLCP
jgi:hypothetical protein